MKQGERIDFITGRAKSGKTHELLCRIKENERRGEKSLFIVPSGSSFEYEKMLAEVCGGGFMHTNVCGFYRLSMRVLDEAGLGGTFITKQGRAMVIRRAIETAELNIFRGVASQIGFALMCDEVIANFVTCGLFAADVKGAAECLPKDSILRAKLLDLAEIYRIAEEYLEGTGQELYAANDALCELIPQSYICDAHLYIDGIENPGEQTYRIIRELMYAAKSVTFAITCDNGSAQRCFERENKIYARLRTMAKEEGFAVNVQHKVRENRYDSAVLSHLERELWQFPVAEYTQDSSDIVLAVSKDISEEVQQMAAHVLELAYNGVRYRDMAVVAAAPEKYDLAVKSLFSELGIPVFSDNKLNLSSTNAVRLIKAALRCVTGGYKTRDVISLMKTELVGVENAESEVFENYITEYGITGSDFFSVFVLGDVPVTCEDTRKKIIEPLRAMQSKMSRATVADKVDAISDYLSEMNVQEKLVSIVERLTDEGELAAAKQYSQVWDLISDVLFQLKSIMGDIHISNEKLMNIVEEGFTADIIGIIPAGVDMLSYSDVGTQIPNGVDYLFVLGAQADDFPTVRKDEGIIDDEELRCIQDTGLNVWMGVQGKREQDEINIYKLLTSPKKGLYISYPTMYDGEYMQPAPILQRICNMTGRTCEKGKYDLHTEKWFASKIRELADKKELSCEDERLVAWFLQDKSRSDAAKKLTDAVFFSPEPTPLDREFATKLYENRVYGTATRLEKYNSCPFSHFMKYGLRAKPRKVFRAKAVDEGSFCHEVIDAFVKYVKKNNIDYKSLCRDECDYITDMVAKPILESFGNGIFTKTPRNEAHGYYLMAVLRDTVYAIVYHMSKGDFEFFGSEIQFGLGTDSVFPPLSVPLRDGGMLYISGKIDRIDSYKSETGTDNFRVIDYKMNGEKIDFEKLYEGVKLQLPIYLEASMHIGRAVHGCGMYYMPIQKASAGTQDSEKMIKSIISDFKLRGLMLSDVEIIHATDGSEKLSSRSDVVSVTKITGELKTAMPKEQLDAVRAFAMRKAKETAERILSGNIDISPFKSGDWSACTHCDYKSVCMFDEALGCKYRRLGKTDYDDIFDLHNI